MILFSDEHIQKTTHQKSEILQIILSSQFKYSGNELLVSDGIVVYREGYNGVKDAIFDFYSKICLPKFQTIYSLFERLVVYPITVTDKDKFQELADDMYEHECLNVGINKERQPMYTRKLCSMARLRYVHSIGPCAVCKINEQWYLINFAMKPNTDLGNQNSSEAQILRNYFEVAERRRMALGTSNIDDIIKTIFYLCQFNQSEFE